MEYRKAIQYSDFIKLAPEVRREHANFFLKNYPEYCPVALNVEHAGKPVPLRMCKYNIANSDF